MKHNMYSSSSAFIDDINSEKFAGICKVNVVLPE